MLKQTIAQLTRSIKNKKISSVELVEFYLKRIKQINPLINAVIQYDEVLTLKKAKAADKKVARGGKLGKLHGIPFTAKDWLETKEFISAAGMKKRRNYYPKENAAVIDRLEKEGAILIGKTNVPLDGIETENPVYGRTHNPYRLENTPGGSSGGEAAAISSGLTCFGIGSDSGGSIRIPCHFCGIAGLKPTTGRVPSTGHFPEIGGFIDPRSQIGPMARFVSDLAIIYPILCGHDGIDPYVIEMPQYRLKDLASLKVAYYINHDQIIPNPDVVSAVKESIRFIKPQVKKVKDHEPDGLSKVLDITFGYWSLYKTPPGTKDYLNLLKDWDRLRSKLWGYMQDYDAIITPVCTTPAYKYGDKGIPAERFPYTLTYNLVGWPCAVVRVGTSKEGLPINVQVVAKPFHEEVCLLIAKRLEEQCGWQEPKFKVDI